MASSTPQKRVNYKSDNETSDEENAAKNPCVLVIESSEDLIKKSGFKFFCDCKSNLNNFKQGNRHQILFDYTDTVTSKPFPNEYVDKWNDNFVRLPCSPQNINSENNPQWQIITKSLKKLSEDLVKHPEPTLIKYSIKNYNQDFKEILNLDVLYSFFENINEDVKNDLLKNVIPKMALLAIELPNQITCGIHLLKSQMNASITMSRKQCACLLANAFFCTFPKRNSYDDSDNEYDSYPFINFTQLFCSAKKTKKHHSSDTKIEKLKCIFNYFKRVVYEEPRGCITFTRQCIDETNYPNFEKSSKQIRNPIVCFDGTIETCKGATQLDFANKFIGGGVLGSGCVQEEIRFILCPELIVSLLFSQKMEYNECLIVKGSEQYSSYSGYGNSFKFKSNYQDETPFDNWNRMDVEVLAIDALSFRFPASQFSEAKIIRELKKSYCGFYSSNDTHQCSALASGNWGCGVFNGDRQLKFLIQLMAASETDRDLIYFTFRDLETVNVFNNMMKIIQEKKLTVGNIYELLVAYNCQIQGLGENGYEKYNILKFLKDTLNI